MHARQIKCIEIALYSYGRWFFLLAFQNLNRDGRKKRKHHNRKKGFKLRFVVERRFKFALCDVRLSLRHLGKIKLVSKNVDSS